MITTRTREGRALEYRRLAAAAQVQAEASTLAHVRAKHEQAAARWNELAGLDERPTARPPAPSAARVMEPAE